MAGVLGSAAGYSFQEWLRRQVRARGDVPRFPNNVGDVSTYQQKVREMIKSAAGPAPQYDPLEAEIHQVHQRDGYRIEAVSFPTFGGLRMTANAYVPDTDKPVPGVLSVHGHSKHGRRDAKMQQRCIALAKSGYFVLAVDAIGNGERSVELPGSYHGGNLAAALWTAGYSLFGIQIYENYRAVDYLVSRPEVDADRLGISGASGGGNQSFYSGAWDDRLKAVVPVCSTGSYKKLVSSFNCMCETPFGLAGSLEQYDIMASMAPRALFVIVAKVDNVSFRFEDAQATMDQARQVWDLLGTPERVAFAALEERHGYPHSARELCLGWFNRWLKGDEEVGPVRQPEVTIEDYATLSCYPEAKVSEVMTLPAFFESERERLLAGAPKPTVDDVRRVLAPTPEVEFEIETVNLLGSTPSGTTGVSRLLRGADGTLIPAHTHWPDFSQTADRLLIMVGDRKEEVANSPLAKEALEKGIAVWAVDLPGLGEATLRNEITEHISQMLGIQGRISAVRACHMLGLSLVGYWISTLQALARTLSTGMKSVALSASGGPATGVLVGASLLDAFDQFIISNPLATYRTADRFQDIPFEALIPDLLSLGDIPDVAALAAPKPMTIVAPLSPDGTELPIFEARRILSPLAERYVSSGRSQAFHLMTSAEASATFSLELSK